MFYLLFFYQPLLFGKDFGIRGELFKIQEENLLSVIQKQLSKKTTEHSLDPILHKLQTAALYPQSPLVPSAAATHRIYYYDPTFFVNEPITDQNGVVLFQKGTKVNPLQNRNLSSGLLFFDGDNPFHLRWARTQPESCKWILVHGNPFKLEEQEKRPVYFDQQGFSVSKFHIQHIPARITQEGLRLKIEEFSIQELENPS